MLSILKKSLIILVLLIIILGGGYWFFVYSKNTGSKPTTSMREEEKNWGNISGWFLDDPDLKKLWKNHDFTYEQTNDWINTGLNPTDAAFAFWLKNEKKLTPEEFLNRGNEKSLREEWINGEQGGEKNAIELKIEIINRLNIWLTDYTAWNSLLEEEGEEENQKETQEAVEKTIKNLRSSTLDDNQKLISLKNLLENHYQESEDISDSDSSDEENFSIRRPGASPAFRKNKTSQNYQQLLKLCEQWENLKEKPEVKKWFWGNQKLTKEEVDWANEQTEAVNKNKDKIMILLANQLDLIREDNSDKEWQFFWLLKQLQKKEVELVFIPVNNNSFWSLLVYEKDSGLFYHYDTSNEKDNSECIAPILKKLMFNLRPNMIRMNIDSEWWKSWIKEIDTKISLEKAEDSGIMIISIIEQIINLYNGNYRIVKEVGSKDGEGYTKSRHAYSLVEKNINNIDLSEERKKWYRKLYHYE